MAAVVEILVGAARQGKTPRLLAEYRQALARSAKEGDWGAALWLSPTHRARVDVLDKLLDDSLSVCFAPNVVTFKDFAEQILKWCPKDVTAISDVARTALLRAVIAELLQKEQLEYFAPIADTAGFLRLTGQFIKELKQDEIWPERFADACRKRGDSPKDCDLFQIYDAYQRQLTGMDRYDDEGRFWSARTEVQEGELRPYENVSLVVVDGFTDFTVPQYEILDKLAELSKRMLISLPLEWPLVRKDLFAKSSAALQRLQKLPATGIEIRSEHGGAERGDRSPAFEQIAEKLFGNPREVARSNDARGVEILATTGQLGEVEAVAARVKRLLLDGTSPRDIVVAFRTLDDYADLVSEVFTACGIPHACEAQIPLSQAPIIKAVCSLLQFEEEDWQFERLMSVLDSGYFRPKWNDFDLSVARRALAESLRELRVHAGRDTTIRALEGKVRSLEQRRERDLAAGISSVKKSRYKEPNYAAALTLAQKLSDSLESLRQKHSLAEWIEVTPALADATGLLQSMGTAANVKDRDAWPAFLKALEQVAEIENQCGKKDRNLSLAEFQGLLDDLILPQPLPTSIDERGRVRVLDAQQVRGLDVPHLFLAGLSEGSFPQIRNDDCLYNEAERRNLNDHGLALGHRSSQSQDEMLLFYGVVTRAAKNLVLSYPSISAAGQPMFPSPYLAALRDLFEPESLSVTTIEQLHPVPAVEQVQSASDLRLAATSELTFGRARLFGAMAKTREFEPVARNILAAVDMNNLRFHERGFTSYEGHLAIERHAKILAERYPADYQFSATQLEAYATCPFRFFLSEVLGVAPLDSPRAGTDFLARGNLLHGVLADLHRELAEAGQSELQQSEKGTLQFESPLVSRFREMVQQRLKRKVHATELQRVLASIEEKLLHDWATAYEDQLRLYRAEFGETWDAPPVPLLFEVPFGNAPDEEGEARGEAFDSLTVGEGKKQVRVRGRIDRIDVGKIENQPVFNVIDYKSGMPPRFDLDDVSAGLSLQLALYTLAVARMNLAGPNAVPAQMGYWSIKETGFVAGLKGRAKSIDEEGLQVLEQKLEEVLPRLVQGMRSGQFPVDSPVADCTGRCPYNTVCRVNQIRPLAEKLEKRRKLE